MDTTYLVPKRQALNNTANSFYSEFHNKGVDLLGEPTGLRLKVNTIPVFNLSSLLSSGIAFIIVFFVSMRSQTDLLLQIEFYSFLCDIPLYADTVL